MRDLSLRDDVGEYFAGFSKILAGLNGGAATEMASRPIAHKLVESLINSSNARATARHETAGAAGRPDWTVEDVDDFGVYTLIDHKSLNPNGRYALKAREHEQISGYLELGVPVVVFDGVSFDVYGTDAGRLVVVDSASLAQKPLPTDGSEWVVSESGLARVTEIFNGLTRTVARSVVSEQRVVETLAKYARQIRSVAGEALELQDPDEAKSGSERELVLRLARLRQILAAEHDAGLSEAKTCSGFVAQVLVFGLFDASRRMEQSPEERGGSPERRARALLAGALNSPTVGVEGPMPAFSAVLNALDSCLGPDHPIGFWYDAASRYLAHAQVRGIDDSELDFHILFERFFVSFDPEARFDRGVFYTPGVLASWMVGAVEMLRAEKFSEEAQTASAKIVDPCVGTGGFLEAYMKHARPDDRASLVGLEILPAPLALAQTRLATAASETRFGGSIRLHLGDTLRDPLEAHDTGVERVFENLMRGFQTDASAPITVLLGNPPASIHSENSTPRDTVESLLDGFRPVGGNRRSNVQKALNDEAYRFLAWGLNVLVDSQRGVVAFVLPQSAIEKTSTSAMRAKLLETLDEIWVLELDDDARKSEATQSLFNVMQGRCVLFGTLGSLSRKPQGGRARVHFMSIANAKLEAKNSFLSSPPVLSDFQEQVPWGGQRNRFDIAASGSRDLWNMCWPLEGTVLHEGIFVGKCGGLKLSPNALTVHLDRKQLARRARELGAARVAAANDATYRTWYAGRSKPPRVTKFTPEVLDALEGKSLGTASQQYAFRPFVTCVALLDPGLLAALGNAPGKGTRDRPELRAAFSEDGIGIAVSPAPKDLGSSLTRFTSFCHFVPDNDLVARGTAAVYPLRWQAKRPNEPLPKTLPSNIAEAARAIHWPHSKKVGADESMIYYVYAILNSSAYLRQFESMLYDSADSNDPARVPVFSEASVRVAIRDLGVEIAECEREGAPGIALEGCDAEWKHSASAPPELTAYEGVETGSAVSLHLRGPSGDLATVHGIPKEVFDLRISGYNVLDQWLKLRKAPYLNREFTPADLESLVQLVGRIAQQQVLLKRVDEVVLAGLRAGEAAICRPVAISHQ